MERTTATARLKAHKRELKRLGVVHLYLFGSTARDAAHEDSDVDLFFDHVRGTLGLFQLMDLQQRAGEILGANADLTTRSSLHPSLRKQIEASAVQIF